jgi:hypothetical protein
MGGRQVFGWWRVDPKDGASLGLGAHGWGVEMAEYAVILIDTALCYHAFKSPNTGGKTKGGRENNAQFTCLVLGAFAFMYLLLPAGPFLLGLSTHTWAMNALLVQGLMVAAGVFVLE